MTASNFDRALSATLKHEGGWADHPKDPGGATNRGITLATFRRLVKPGATKADLKAITTEQVAAVYRKGFWSQVLADQLPGGVDFAVFDYAVNSGPVRAVKALQALVGAKADGVVGPKTIAAVNAVANIDELIEDLCAQRLAFVKRLSTWPTFGKGWERRIAAVRKLALEMARQQATNLPDEPTQPEPAAPVPDAPTPAPEPSLANGINWGRVGIAVALLAAAGWLALNLLT